MRLLVTGGAGYIGSHIVKSFIENGDEVTVIDDLSTGHRWAVWPGATFVKGGIGDEALLEQVFAAKRYEAVMHFAASSEVAESVLNPVKYYQNNVTSSLSLFRMCQKFGVDKIIFSSTASVYGDQYETAVSEQQRIQPIHPYGASKWMAERALTDLAKAHSKLRFVILRYFNVAGASLDSRLGEATPQAFHLIKLACEVVVGQRSQLKIFGTDYPTFDGTCLRDYVHVLDVVDAHLKVLRHLNQGGASDVFNIGSGCAFSVRQVIQAMQEISGVVIPVVETVRRPGDGAILAADTKKILHQLGWQPKFSDLTTICQTALEWEKVLHRRQQEQTIDA